MNQTATDITIATESIKKGHRPHIKATMERDDGSDPYVKPSGVGWHVAMNVKKSIESAEREVYIKAGFISNSVYYK